MARRSGVVHTIVKASHEAEKNRVRQQQEFERAQTQAAREADRALKAFQRAQVADAKERARLYAEARSAETDLKNEQLSSYVSQLNQLLHQTLGVDDYFDLETLKSPVLVQPFNPGSLAVAQPEPVLTSFLPPQPSGLKGMMPGAKAKHAQMVEAATSHFNAEMQKFLEREDARRQALERAKLQHEVLVVAATRKAQLQHAEIDQLNAELIDRQPDAVVQYFSLVLESSLYPDGFPQHAKLAFVPESKQLVVEYDLPAYDVVPEVGSFKFTKSKDEIASSARPATQRKALYASIIAQITLRTLHELFESDRLQHLESIVLNGYVDSIDAGTGQPARTCVVTVRTSRDVFDGIDLSRVDPAACLRMLNASVSKSPNELAPVRPVLEFSMVDPRFIEETDVLTGLDQRPNLMELTPGEFESLISNLFQRMGLETRLTQASRDGGVDCVAFDPRPIFGGKVVIQAKRYRNTVDVSAVRDLFGTVQNEGASKGILVTTSGYGKASFDFAQGKPLELLSGSHLLHLLSEHAGIEARIVMPEELS